MATILNEPGIAITAAPAESRVVLRNISWETYERMLEDLADCSAPRLTYDQGDLEIMSPQAEHEVINGTIKVLLNLVCEELEIEIRDLGSTTFKREDAERGFEADSCFYLQNELLIRGKERLDLPMDPPPDLVFEVDITSSSLDKDAIFAQLGVPEVWRYDGRTLEILVLSGNSYESLPASSVLPFMTADLVTHFIVEGSKISRLEWIKAVRAWARQQKSFRSSR